jgi:hypothetical protein
VQLYFGSPAFRVLHRYLAFASIGGGLFCGWFGVPHWLLAPPAAFAVFLILEDRAVQNAIMDGGAWPSPGYRRFLIGTNLSSLLRHSALSAFAYSITSVVAGLLG